MAGYLFGAVSLLLGLGLFLLALELRRVKTPRNARRVFLGSLVYLPLLMVFMVLDRHPCGDLAVYRWRQFRRMGSRGERGTVDGGRQEPQR